jgi:hypothetical protein
MAASTSSASIPFPQGVVETAVRAECMQQQHLSHIPMRPAAANNAG